MLEKIEISDYKIIDELGSGGFGIVYKAKSKTDVIVAIKILKQEYASNKKFIENFFKEALNLARLSHPNITKILDLIPIDNNYAIIMEYVDGVTLEEVFGNKNISIDEKLKMAIQVLDSVQYAHENNILHRDIKPANIMIDRKKKIKLMDFGIAKATKMKHSETTNTEKIALTPGYASPEHFDSTIGKISSRSDIYSLGVLFYVLFTNTNPFKSDDNEITQAMYNHIYKVPPPPSELNNEIPRNINNAIRKALAKKPPNRFSSCIDFKKALLGEKKLDIDESTLIFDKANLQNLKKTQKPESNTTANIVFLTIIIFLLGIVAYLFIDVSTKEIDPQTKIDITKVIGQMILIPEGEFTIGSDNYNEKPEQKVYLDAFYIDQYLVTNKQFKEFIDKTGYETDAEKEDYGTIMYGANPQKRKYASWKKPDGMNDISNKDDHPVTQVSYNDALNYCKSVGKDLPTEAQWEKAARGPLGFIYPWGNEKPDDSYANYANMNDDTTPVITYDKGKSYYNIYDMAGNVRQWCKDYYTEYSETNKRRNKNPIGAITGRRRVLKGASFIEGIDVLRSSNRMDYEPGYRRFDIGFRCAGLAE